MEHIGKTLEKLPSLGSTPHQKNSPPSEPDESPAEKKESLRLRLGITSWDNTFENFKTVKGTENTVKLFKELSEGSPWFMLLCYGSVGCGKTHLCEALSIALARQSIIPAPVYEWGEVIRAFKQAFRSEIKDLYDYQFEAFRRAPRLIIDDVGMGSSGSSWEWGELEDIINYRYRANLLTVVTTNLDLKELPSRVVSRFQDAVKGRVALMDSGDYRPKKVLL